MLSWIYELDPPRIFSAPWLALEAALNKTRVKLNLLIDIDMLLMVEKCIRVGICHAINRYVRANNNYMKDYGGLKNYLNHVNNLYRWVMSQKFLEMVLSGLKKGRITSLFTVFF